MSTVVDTARGDFQWSNDVVQGGGKEEKGLKHKLKKKKDCKEEKKKKKEKYEGDNGNNLENYK